MESDLGPLFVEDRSRGDAKRPPSEGSNTSPAIVLDASLSTPDAEVVGARKRRRSVAAAAKPAAWIDEDDDDAAQVGRDNGIGIGNGTDTRAAPPRPPAVVPVAAVKRLRKLREHRRETVLPASEYAARVREYFVTEAARHAPGAWARLPTAAARTAGQREGAPRHKGSAATSAGGVGDGGGDDDHDDDDSGSDEEDGLQDGAGQDLEKARSNENADGELHVEDSVRRLLASTGKILSARAERALGAETLSPGKIDIRRVSNVNRDDPNKSVVRCVEFHPTGRLVLTAGLDKSLRIFNVDGKSNPKVQGIHLQDLPIHSAHFTNGGDAIVMTGRRGYFYRFDLGSGAVVKVQTLQCGQSVEKSLERCVVSPDGTRLAILGGEGRVLVVCAKSLRQTGVLRANATCSAAAFSATNEHHMYTAGRGGNVYLWDVRRHGCVDQHADEGSVHGTALASSAGHYAVGSDSGVVNVYRRSTLAAGRDEAGLAAGRVAKPERALFNLTTKVSSMAFNCDGRLLAMASESLKNAVRLVHVPTMTVYGNWPTQATNLRRIFCMAFSPRGEYLAMGNDKGSALLFRIRNGYPLAS
jgi:U3 small nucleolar RNA-associated protein 18